MIIPCKCEKCLKPFNIEVAEGFCPNCFMEKYFPDWFSKLTQKKKSKWLLLKQISWWALLTLPVFLFIYAKWGLKAEVIGILMMWYGQSIHEIWNWCVRKF